MTPLDVVKIRLQAQRTPFSKGTSVGTGIPKQCWAGGGSSGGRWVPCTPCPSLGLGGSSVCSRAPLHLPPAAAFVPVPMLCDHPTPPSQHPGLCVAPCWVQGCRTPGPRGWHIPTAISQLVPVVFQRGWCGRCPRAHSMPHVSTWGLKIPLAPACFPAGVICRDVLDPSLSPCLVPLSVMTVPGCCWWGRMLAGNGTSPCCLPQPCCDARARGFSAVLGDVTVWGCAEGCVRAGVGLTVMPSLLLLSGKCFLYCNGLMDHLYVCQNGNSCTAWYKTPTCFNGTLVRAAGTACPGVGVEGCPSPRLTLLCAAFSPQDAFVKITRHEGIRSLWSGLPPTL